MRGRGLRRPLTSSESPEWTLYLLPHEPPARANTSQSWLRWRDFWIPSDRDQARVLLHEAYRRARSGQRVEITCTGGRGRTGTAIACIAQLAGLAPDRAVRWTRNAYHPGAIETPWQRRYVRRFLAHRAP
ncbi:MAG: protein tyrosine phosphatase [Cumulibacter sp.]